RIEEIASAIELQKRVLRDLVKKQKRRSRPTERYPRPSGAIAFELPSHFFLRCVPDAPIPNEKVAPMLLFRVCRAWSDIALSTPLLW
ncbi:hypothetical protein C8R43DRAFT_853753, partial [Mycena crocata]